MSRARHEAAWTHSAATVRGRRNANRGWVIGLGFLAIILVSSVVYTRYLGVSTVTYELRQCREPLTEMSSWAQVEAAGCEPLAATGDASVRVMEESSTLEADAVEGATWTFDDVPVNSPAHAVKVVTPLAGRTAVVAEPTNRRVRTELTSDAAGTRWTGHIGSRGPTEYWILLTP